MFIKLQFFPVDSVYLTYDTGMLGIYIKGKILHDDVEFFLDVSFSELLEERSLFAYIR